MPLFALAQSSLPGAIAGVGQGRKWASVVCVLAAWAEAFLLLEAFPGLPTELQVPASVECLRVIYRGAPDEVKMLLRKSPVDMSDPRIVSYLAHLRNWEAAFEEGIKARGWDADGSLERIYNRFGYLCAAGVQETPQNTLAFAAAGVSPEIGAKTLFGERSSAGAESASGGAQIPPAVKREEDEEDNMDGDGYDGEFIMEGERAAIVRRSIGEAVLALNISGSAAHDSRAVDLLLRLRPLLRPTGALEVRCCGTAFEFTGGDPRASIHYQCASEGCTNAGLVLCHCLSTLSHNARYCEKCDKRIHTLFRPACERLSLFFPSTGAYQLPAVLPLPPNYFLPEGTQHFLAAPSELVFSTVPAPCDAPLRACGLCGSYCFEACEWDKGGLTVAGLEATYIGARVTKFACFDCGAFAPAPSGAVLGAGADAMYGRLAGAGLAPSTKDRSHTLICRDTLDTLTRLNAAVPSGVPAHAAAAALFPGEARHVDTTREAINAHEQASSLAALVVEAASCPFCPRDCIDTTIEAAPGTAGGSAGGAGAGAHKPARKKPRVLHEEGLAAPSRRSSRVAERARGGSGEAE
jgi:hypothetical protein